MEKVIGLKVFRTNINIEFLKFIWRSKYFLLMIPGCAAMLVELHNLKGYPSEIDLFIAQAVLQYLCLQNKKTAAVAFSSYTTQHPNIKTGPPYLLPLLNFIWFLLKAIER